MYYMLYAASYVIACSWDVLLQCPCQATVSSQMVNNLCRSETRAVPRLRWTTSMHSKPANADHPQDSLAPQSPFGCHEEVRPILRSFKVRSGATKPCGCKRGGTVLWSGFRTGHHAHKAVILLLAKFRSVCRGHLVELLGSA